MNILTVEEMSNNVEGIETIISKCRSKAYLLETQFKVLMDGHDMEIEDETLWAQGIHNTCNEIVEDLAKIYGLTHNFSKSVELCSIDAEKVQKEKKYLKSIGIQDP